MFSFLFMLVELLIRKITFQQILNQSISILLSREENLCWAEEPTATYAENLIEILEILKKHNFVITLR